MRCRIACHFVVLAAVSLGGCSYYRVTDPTTGREYYTNNWMAGTYRWSGSAVFVDARTGKSVTLASFEVEQIPKDEYDLAVIPHRIH